MKQIFLILSTLLTFSAFAQIPNYVATNGLVAFWPFAGNANDASGNGNNGINNGAIATVGHTGGGGDAYYFSSAACGTYVQTNVNVSTINTNGAMSLSFWIERVGNGCLSPRVMEFGSCTTCPGQILITWVNGTNTIVLRHYLTATNFVIYSFANTNSNNWYHIVYTNDGTTAKFYLNGVLVNTMPSPNPVQLSGDAAFGRMNHPAYDSFNGNLDDIGLWNRALSDCEVNCLYTGNASTTFAFKPLQDTTIICDSIHLDAGSGFSTYKWSDGTSAQTDNAKTNGWDKVTVTNALGCSATDSTFISIIKPTISSSKTIVCKGSAVTLTANGIPGSSQTLVNQFTETFLAPWTFTVPTIVGQYYSMVVSGTLSDHCVPGDTWNNADAAFFYDRVPIQDVTQGPGGTAPDRLFTDWNGLSLRPDVDVYNPTHTYTYTFPVSTQVSQPFSYADAGGPGAYGDNCGQMSFQIYQIHKSNATYTWSAFPAATAGLIPADINLSSLTVNPTATTTYYVTVNDGVTNCLDSIIITVPVIDTTLTVTGPLNFCSNNGSVNFQAAIGSTNYVWLQNGSVIAGATNTKNYTATQSGIYQVALTSAIGCTDSSRAVTVAIYPQPTAGFAINNSTQCFNANSFVFTNSSIINVGTLTDQWSFGDGNSDIAKDETYSYAAPNTIANPSYTVQLSVKSNNGCTDTIRKTVTVNPTPITPVITANGPTTICGNGSVLLSSSATSGNQWYQNGILIPATIGQDFSANSTGTYTVISTINNCSSDISNTIQISLHAIPPNPTITPNGPITICENTNAILTSSALNGNQWYNNGSPISGENSQTITVSDSGTYKVSISDTCGIYSSTDVVVSITSSPANIRYPSLNVQIGTNYPLVARNFGSSYLWAPSDGLSSDNSDSTTTSNFSHTQDYIIQIKTASGCSTYDSLLVNAFVIKGILVPTAFSPNGDGLNDVLKPTLINIYQLNYFRIYNKWGQLVFQTSNPANGWDGTYKGATQAIGNYIWMAQGIDIDGKIVTNSGQVLIVR